MFAGSALRMVIPGPYILAGGVTQEHGLVIHLTAEDALIIVLTWQVRINLDQLSLL